MEDLTIAIENFNYSFLLLFGGISVAHGAVMTAFRGQTLGKMLLRIQVVDAEGNVPPWQKAILRELLRGVILMALFPLGCCMCGFQWTAASAAPTTISAAATWSASNAVPPGGKEDSSSQPSGLLLHSPGQIGNSPAR